jgi:hypothetical protein
MLGNVTQAPGYGRMLWVQDRSQWLAVVNTAMNPGGRDFLDQASDYLRLMKDCGQWNWLRWTAVNKIMNRRVPYKAETSLNS